MVAAWDVEQFPKDGVIYTDELMRLESLDVVGGSDSVAVKNRFIENHFEWWTKGSEAKFTICRI